MNSMMWEGDGQNQSWPIFRYFPGICCRGWGKLCKTLGELDSQLSQDQDLQNV